MEPRFGRTPESVALPAGKYSEAISVLHKNLPDELALLIGTDGKEADTRALFLRRTEGTQPFTILTSDGAYHAPTGFESDWFAEAMELVHEGNLQHPWLSGVYSKVDGKKSLTVQFENRRMVGAKKTFVFSLSDSESSQQHTLTPMPSEEFEKELEAVLEVRRKRDEKTKEKVHNLLSS